MRTVARVGLLAVAAACGPAPTAGTPAPAVPAMSSALPPWTARLAPASGSWLAPLGRPALVAEPVAGAAGATACLVVERDDRGRERWRTTLWQLERTFSIPTPRDYLADACLRTSVVVVDDELIVAVPAGAPGPVLGVERGGAPMMPALVARVGRDHQVRWHRRLDAAGVSIHVPTLAIGRATLLVATTVERREEGADLPVTVGEVTARLPSSATYGGAALLLGLDPATGASRWLRLLPTEGGARLAHGRALAAGGAAGLAVALPLLLRGRVDGAEVAGSDLIVAVDEVTGEVRWRRTFAVERCPASSGSLATDRCCGVLAPPIELRGLGVDAAGAVLVHGVMRGVLRIDGVEALRTPCDEPPAHGALGGGRATRAGEVRAAPALLASPPPPWQPPPPPAYGFIVRLRPPAAPAR